MCMSILCGMAGCWSGAGVMWCSSGMVCSVICDVGVS